MRNSSPLRVHLSHTAITSKLRALAFAAIIAGAGALLFASAGDAARGFSCNGEPADVVMQKPGEFVGTPASEVIVGSQGDDVIRGGNGNDVICGRGGDDAISGGGANDELHGDQDDDTLRGKRGNDDLDGGFDITGKGQVGNENDFCLGGKPKPDTEAKGDFATSSCEHVVSALTNPE
jgi:Ca2+-binding RTX toxin-like protein